MSASMQVFSPAAAVPAAAPPSMQTLDRLAGKVIGFVDNSKPNFNNLVDDLAELLISRYGAAAVVKRGKPSPSIPAPDTVMQELYGQCDAVVTGAGD